MKATIKIENAQGLKGAHRDAEWKNGVTTGYKAIAIIDGKVVTLADMRIAISKSGKPYACFWACKPAEMDENGKFISDGMWNNGSGTAAGYGYHTASAAAEIAIEKAGFSLSDPIHGRGDGAIREAVQAIGECLYDGPVYTVDCCA